MESSEQNYLASVEVNIARAKKQQEKFLQFEELTENKSFELEESRIEGKGIDGIVEELEILRDHRDVAKRYFKMAVDKANDSIRVAHERIKSNKAKDKLWKLTTNYEFMDSLHFLRSIVISDDSDVNEAGPSQASHQDDFRSQAGPSRLAGSSRAGAGPSKPPVRSAIPRKVSRIPTRGGPVINPQPNPLPKPSYKLLKVAPSTIRSSMPKRLSRLPSRIAVHQAAAPVQPSRVVLPSAGSSRAQKSSRVATAQRAMRIPSKIGLPSNLPPQATLNPRFNASRSALVKRTRPNRLAAFPEVAIQPQHGSPRVRATSQSGSHRVAGPSQPAPIRTPRLSRPGTSRAASPSQAGSSGMQRLTRPGTSRAASPSQAGSSGMQRLTRPGTSRAASPSQAGSSGMQRLTRPGTSRAASPSQAGSSGMQRLTRAGTSRAASPSQAGSSGMQRLTRPGTSRAASPSQASSSGMQRMTRPGSSRAASPSQASSSGMQRMTRPGSSRAASPSQPAGSSGPSTSRVAEPIQAQPRRIKKAMTGPPTPLVAMSVDSELAPAPARPKPIQAPKATRPSKTSTPRVTARKATPTIVPYNHMPNLEIPDDLIERDILYVACQLYGRQEADLPMPVDKLVRNMMTIAKNFKMSLISKKTALDTIGALFWRLQCVTTDFLKTFVYHPTNEFFESVKFTDINFSNVIRSAALINRRLRRCEPDKSFGARQRDSSSNAVSEFLNYFDGSVSDLAEGLQTSRKKQRYRSQFSWETLMGDVTIGGHEMSNDGSNVLGIPTSINGGLNQGTIADSERLNYLRSKDIPRTEVAFEMIQAEMKLLEERLKRQGAEGQTHLNGSKVIGKGLKHVLQPTALTRQNLWQARGNDLPRWFPGCYTVFQDSFNLKPVLTTSPSSTFLHAWRCMAPMTEEVN